MASRRLRQIDRERAESGDGWARMHHSLVHINTLRNKTTACKLNNNNNINKQQTKQTQKKINLGSAGCLLVYETLLAKHSTLGKMLQEQGLIIVLACSEQDDVIRGYFTR